MNHSNHNPAPRMTATECHAGWTAIGRRLSACWQLPLALLAATWSTVIFGRVDGDACK